MKRIKYLHCGREELITIDEGTRLLDIVKSLIEAGIVPEKCFYSLNDKLEVSDETILKNGDSIYIWDVSLVYGDVTVPLAGCEGITINRLKITHGVPLGIPYSKQVSAYVGDHEVSDDYEVSVGEVVKFV